MKKSVTRWQVAGFLFTGVAGTLLHFLYDWKKTPVTALLSSVNESTWEHMKLLFIPLFLFAILQSRFIAKEYPNFWCIKLIGTLLGLLAIPVLFYTYTGALGVSADWFNITIFFLAAALTYFTEARLFKSEKHFCPAPILSILLLCGIAVLFAVFTFMPPEIPLFQDPLSGQYGTV